MSRAEIPKLTPQARTCALRAVSTSTALSPTMIGLRRDPLPDSSIKQFDADRMRLLLLETVAAVDAEKMRRRGRALRSDCTLNRTGLLVSTAIGTSAAMQSVERFAHAGIERGRVQHVLAIVVQENIAAPRSSSSSSRPGSARRTSIGAPLPT